MYYGIISVNVGVCLHGFYHLNMYFNNVFIKLINSHSISSIGPKYHCAQETIQSQEGHEWF